MENSAPQTDRVRSDAGDDSGLAPARDLSRGHATRRQIKHAALRLYAKQGLEGVSIREIVQAAGQRNAGSINYYFQSKEALIRELILDVANLLETEKNRLVDELEASGRPATVREIVAILLHMPRATDEHEAADEHALRFLNMVMINHRDLLFDATRGGADRGTRRCFAHLRSLLQDLPPSVLQQRLMLLLLNLFAICSSREAAREQPEVWRSLWGQPGAEENVIDTVTGMLCAPCSAETLAAIGTARMGDAA